MNPSRLLACAFAVSIAWTSAADAQTQEPYFVSVSGRAAEDIDVAWRAIRAQYEPHTPLRDFWISYTRTGDGPALIEFRLGWRGTDLPDGSIHIDPRMVTYSVTVQGENATIQVRDPGEHLTPNR